MRARRAGAIAALVTTGQHVLRRPGRRRRRRPGPRPPPRASPACSATPTVGGSTASRRARTSPSRSPRPTRCVAGAPFTITFPGGTNELPSSSNGLTITSYRDLTLSYQMHGSTFTSGTIQNPGTATINGNPTPNTAAIGPADVFTIGQPGPFPPGTLVTPDVSVGSTAGAVGQLDHDQRAAAHHDRAHQQLVRRPGHLRHPAGHRHHHSRRQRDAAAGGRRRTRRCG